MKKVLVFIFVVVCMTAYSQKSSKPNVLFIIVDDLRPELNVYGQSQIISPNIDRLGQQGLTFKNSFCNVPVCGASRASFLTGVRPTKTRFTVARSRADVDLPGHLSLPRYFKQNGYTTASIGKVYHFPNDDVSAWTTKYPVIVTKGGGEFMNAANVAEEKKNVTRDSGVISRGPAFEIGEETDDFLYRDGLLAKKAIAVLDTLKNSKSPFFLAVGFFKPHLPFVAPKKYYDLYKQNELNLAPNQYVPKNAPAISIANSGELRQYSGVPKDRILPDDYAISLKHGYYASISFVDAMIGEVLKKLDQEGLRENTIVILIGDHGWNLGEHTIWGKHHTYETAVRAPLIISAPNFSGTKYTESLAEFVDIYPTLSELCGLDIPKHCQGKSLVPILRNPQTEVKDEVFTHWRGGEGIHTKRYAYTEWTNTSNQIQANMLYDLQKDKDENINVAGNPEYKKVVDELSGKIKASIRARE